MEWYCRDMRVTLEMAGTDVERVKGCCAPVATPLAGPYAADLSELFKALADPARVQMLHVLKHATAPVCVCDFTAVLDLEQPTVSHHLARLRRAGLVRAERQGIWAFYELDPAMSGAARAAVDMVP
jgi:ArsR family transcriptional regulator